MCLFKCILRRYVAARSMSEPSIIVRGRSNTGEPMMLDDFRESYWWLRDNTPEDARVMAWWDYGYQINGWGCTSSIQLRPIALETAW
jgi:dolichyl-diphosphooligosaccharide--protein glycosyltransferase